MESILDHLKWWELVPFLNSHRALTDTYRTRALARFNHLLTEETLGDKVLALRTVEDSSHFAKFWMNDANGTMNLPRVDKETNAGVNLLSRWWWFHLHTGLTVQRRRSDFGYAVLCHYCFGYPVAATIATGYRRRAIAHAEQLRDADSDTDES